MPFVAGRSTTSLDVMRKAAIQSAGYAYFAISVLVVFASIWAIFDDEPTHLLRTVVLAIIGVFAGYMGVKSREYLGMAPVVTRTQVSLWIGTNFLVGALAGPFFVMLLIIPCGVLAWAVHPRTARRLTNRWNGP
jgi:chromate transport protein ChrA